MGVQDLICLRGHTKHRHQHKEFLCILFENPQPRVFLDHHRHQHHVKHELLNHPHLFCFIGTFCQLRKMGLSAQFI